jgi:multidrug efflux pump subunit AcrA (membrane-fusion protein)
MWFGDQPVWWWSSLSFCLDTWERSPQRGRPPRPVVEVAPVEQRDVPIYGEWIGTLTGQVNADVKAQVTGYLLTRNYKEGSFVHKGQVLFEIDPRPFQAALD